MLSEALFQYIERCKQAEKDAQLLVDPKAAMLEIGREALKRTEEWVTTTLSGELAERATAPENVFALEVAMSFLYVATHVTSMREYLEEHGGTESDIVEVEVQEKGATVIATLRNSEQRLVLQSSTSTPSSTTPITVTAFPEGYENWKVESTLELSQKEFVESDFEIAGYNLSLQKVLDVLSSIN